MTEGNAPRFRACCCVGSWPWDLRDKGRQHWERRASQIRQKQGKRATRGQLGLALAEKDLPWLKAQVADGRVQSWVLSSSSHHSEHTDTDVHTSIASFEPWRLSFAWEFISQSEGLGLRVLCAKPPGSPTSSIHRSETEDSHLGEEAPTVESREDRFGMSTPVLLEEFWAVEAPDTATAAAVFSAVANVLTPELLGTHRGGLQSAECLDSRAEGILQDDSEQDSRLLRAKLCKERDELRATHMLLATSDTCLSLKPIPKSFRESITEDSMYTIDQSQQSMLKAALDPMAFDGMAFVPFLRSRPEVRLLTAVLRVAVEAALYLCEGNMVLTAKLKRHGFDDRNSMKLKRLILPWMCGTAVPDEVLDGLVWGFTFGWPEAPTSLMSTQPTFA